jgi:D-alanyl-D-alanine carboxypeptidase
VRLLINHNRLLKSIDGCIGVKTGYTKSNGRCLVSAAERDGLRLIAVAKVKEKNTAGKTAEEKTQSTERKECGCEERNTTQSATDGEAAKQPKTQLKAKIKAKKSST